VLVVIGSEKIVAGDALNPRGFKTLRVWVVVKLKENFGVLNKNPPRPLDTPP